MTNSGSTETGVARFLHKLLRLFVALLSFKMLFLFRLLDRSELPSTPEPLEARREALRNARRKRKVRLAQTAPANMQHKHNKQDKTMKDAVRNAFTNGAKPNPDARPDSASLDTDRKKSVYLQIAGTGREPKSHVQFDDSEDEDKKRKDLPKPSPRTMLDVMIGLNAFSHVPPPRCVTRSPEQREESRFSLVRSSSISSVYDSTENIAEKFIQQWRSRIASRKQSIYDKLSADTPKPEAFQSRESLALSSVPELELSNPASLRRKSKWTTRTSMKPPAQLPVISQDDDQERREQFQAWVKERKDDIKPSERPESATLNPQQKITQRRNSFVCWLKQRNQTKPDYDDDDDDDSYSSYADPYEIDDGPQNVGDMMKTILNIKTRFRDPVDLRLKKFYRDLDKVKERDAKAQRPLTEKEQKRRWKALMKGIDAALADSSDEEENYFNTI